jgi:hypothetical protein
LNLTIIESNAFDTCSNLSYIRFASASQTQKINLSLIDNSAFVSCSKLSYLEFNNAAIRTIGDYAFSGCSSLKSINLNDIKNLSAISNYSFYNCSSLQSVGTLPNTLTNIGNYAFCNCDLRNINFNYDETTGLPISNLNIIGEHAFENNQKLSGNITFPSSIYSIGNYAFNNCDLSFVDLNYAFNSLYIPSDSTITEIGDYAFYNNKRLSIAKNTALNFSADTICFPDRLNIIGNFAFANIATQNKN